MKKEDDERLIRVASPNPSPHANDDVLLKVPQVAAYLGWSEGTTYHKLKELPGVVHLSARCVRVWRSAVVGYARAHTSTK